MVSINQVLTRCSQKGRDLVIAVATGVAKLTTSLPSVHSRVPSVTTVARQGTSSQLVINPRKPLQLEEIGVAVETSPLEDVAIESSPSGVSRLMTWAIPRSKMRTTCSTISLH